MDDLHFVSPPATLPKADFMAQFGGIYEHSPWVAATLLAQGFDAQDYRLTHFAARMAGIVDAAGHEAQLALLQAHPELAGKLAIA